MSPRISTCRSSPFTNASRVGDKPGCWRKNKNNNSPSNKKPDSELAASFSHAAFNVPLRLQTAQSLPTRVPQAKLAMKSDAAGVSSRQPCRLRLRIRHQVEGKGAMPTSRQRPIGDGRTASRRSSIAAATPSSACSVVSRTSAASSLDTIGRQTTSSRLPSATGYRT
jgi:hypothetical protein